MFSDHFDAATMSNESFALLSVYCKNIKYFLMQFANLVERDIERIFKVFGKFDQFDLSRLQSARSQRIFHYSNQISFRIMKCTFSPLLLLCYFC